ncbi:MAG: SGNH/GDSL hydrolase family protein [Verrucomicrobiota bacterium]|nr:SGNH/GDSL hydrolase family protein [Verrucomicrobiota bacterium]
MRLLLLFGMIFQSGAADFPPVKNFGNAADFGTGIQRAMTLMATSTPEKPNTVRVLFYGQSITEQKWWREVENYLKTSYPHANLLIENRAIGGFSSQLLVKTAETDLYHFYPDLLIFHVYGSHIEYENIIKRVRERTTAEILLQNDHCTDPSHLTEETDPGKLNPSSWNAWMNHSFLPSTARKYGAELVDQHNLWKDYLKTHDLSPSRLLSDSVHLNDHGCYLMAELVKPHLRYRPELPKEKWINSVRTIAVKPDQWKNEFVDLEVDGNRIDLILSPQATKDASIDIEIDGRKPSGFPGVFGFSRSTYYPGTIWPCLIGISSEKQLEVEQWTVRLSEVSDDHKQFKFSLEGSKTGPDGDGLSSEKFVSKSGRIVIEPDDWHLARSFEHTKAPLPKEFVVRWDVIPYFKDRVDLAEINSRGERTVTIAQGIENKPHRLKLITKTPGAIEAVRVYTPPLR